MKLTMQSRVKEVYATPIGHDILYKLLLQLGKKESLITNPVIGNLTLQTLCKLTGKILGEGFFQTFLTLLNSEQALPASDDGIYRPAWWKEAIFYQIYPRSFCDSNGDGIGDLPGILKKLDYLQGLGVSALWLSPIYDSPNDDNGYDIRNYQQIMQEFGTMEDFDRLLAGVHERGMHLIMDLVVNHTSDEHPWFQEALQDKNSKYRDYYFFREEKEAPNNWTSFFSGSAWNYYQEQQVWALHLFSKKQMDLNWENAQVRTEIADMVSWWLDKGVDGFRMDVINYISKAPGLPQGDPKIGQLMEYTGVEHYFYGPRLHEYLRELQERAFTPHQAFSVGETPGLGMQMCKLLTGDERKELDMVFSFDHLETPGHVRFEEYCYDLRYLRDYLIDWQLHYGSHCWFSLFYNNHDNPKMVSKIDPEGKYTISLAKLLAVIQFTRRGTPFIFQGDEMGLTNYPFSSIDQITDVESKNLYQELCEKMTEEEAFAKILTGTREHSRLLLPWVEQPISPDRPRQILRTQVTAFYKQMIALRREHQALVYGSFQVIADGGYAFAYERSDEKETFVVECNLGTRPIRHQVQVEQKEWEREIATGAEGELLQAYEAVVYRKRNFCSNSNFAVGKEKEK